MIEREHIENIDRVLLEFLTENGSCFPEDVELTRVESLLSFLEQLLTIDEIPRDEFIKSDLPQMLAELQFSKLIEMRDYGAFAIAFCVDTHISADNYPVLFRITDDWRTDGLDRHNDLGYHYHYYKKTGGNFKQADAMMTFDPHEDYFQYPGINKVFWERHGRGTCVKCQPENFGKKKRIKIYESMFSFLTARNKVNFRAPSQHAQVLYP